METILPTATMSLSQAWAGAAVSKVGAMTK
jgi:hypothetical protein